MKKCTTMLIAVTMVFAVVGSALADLNDGLVAYYPFNENANDESGNGNDGTVNGAVLTEDRFGNLNSAYNFDGVDDYISISTMGLPNTDEAKSGFAWIKITESNAVDLVIYDDNIIELSIDALGYFQGMSRGTARCVSNVMFTDNEWHLVGATLTVPDFTVNLYIDGNLVHSCPQPPGGGTLATPKIGEFHGTGHYRNFNGNIDEIRIYNRSLSESEIQELYNEGNNVVADLNDPVYLVEGYPTGWSTDGTRIAIKRSYNIYTIGIDGTNERQVTFFNGTEGCGYGSAWGGEYRPGTNEIYWMDDTQCGWYIAHTADDGLGGRTSTGIGGHNQPLNFSEDGMQFAFAYYHPSASTHRIYIGDATTNAYSTLFSTSKIKSEINWGNGENRNKIVYSRELDGVRSAFVYDIANRTETRVTPATLGNVNNPNWGNGNWLVFVLDGDVWTMDLDDGIFVRLTNDDYPDIQPHVSPGGDLVVYGSYRNNVYETYLIPVVDGDSDGIPIAEAGTDQTVNEEETVTLDGSASSDPENDTLTCSWQQLPGGTGVTLNSTNNCITTFTAPTVPFGGETLTFQLTVNDGTQDSEPDMVNITIKNVNHQPVANAGDDKTVKEDSQVILDGSDSYDEDSEPLTFEWEQQTEGTPVPLTLGENGIATFTAPAITTEEILTFELTVYDGINYSLPDTIAVTVENVNHAPEADAGKDQTVDENSVVTLNGGNSSDPDGDELTCHWEQIGENSVTLSNNGNCTATFKAPLISNNMENITFQLTVTETDVPDSSDTDEVIIHVQDVNAPPSCELAVAKPEMIWPPNHKMVPIEILNVTDPDDDQLYLEITEVTQDEDVNGLGDGDTSPDAILINNSQLQLRAERAGGDNGRVYQVNFLAVDEWNQSCTGMVTVCVPPNKKKNVGCIDDGQEYNSFEE